MPHRIRRRRRHHRVRRRHRWRSDGRVGAVPAALWYAGAGFFGLQAGTTALSIKAFDKKRAKYESKDFGQKD